MDINTIQALAIPLWWRTPEEARTEMEDPQHSSLARYTLAAAGKWLGFIIGPAAKETAWTASMEKFESRLKE